MGRVLAIDGPVGSGKSAVARRVAARIGARHVDSGALYRCATLKALCEGVSLEDAAGLAGCARRMEVVFEPDAAGAAGGGGEGRVLLDGGDVTRTIRTPELTRQVHHAASAPEVRAALLEVQRAFRETGDVVMEGRDIGTVIFPDAELKIFLTASAAERARRRMVQLAAAGIDRPLSEVEADLAERDRRDTSRAVAPLARAADAVELDTTGMPLAEVVDRIAARWRERAGGA